MLTRIIWAMPDASMRSDLFGCASRKALVWRVSMHTTGRPSAKPLNSHCDNGPAPQARSAQTSRQHPRAPVPQPDQRDALRQTPGLCFPIRHQAQPGHRPRPGLLRDHDSQHEKLETATRPRQSADPDLLRRQKGEAVLGTPGRARDRTSWSTRGTKTSPLSSPPSADSTTSPVMTIRSDRQRSHPAPTWMAVKIRRSGDPGHT